jgi:hypothetical protein
MSGRPHIHQAVVPVDPVVIAVCALVRCVTIQTGIEVASDDDAKIRRRAGSHQFLRDPTC